jgi:enoyl-CoA hydratase/carnithine racemase
MKYNEILYHVEDGIAKITLNIPEKMNRLSISTMKEIISALDVAKKDGSVRVILIGAVGEAFCAGANLGDFKAHTVIEGRNLFKTFAELSKKFIDLGKPSIAAVNGLALAGGFGLAIYPDITVASDRAKFGLPEINVGLWSCMVSASLPRILGRKKALELLLTGDLIDAKEAEKIGLINRVVPHDQLEETVMDLSRKLCKKSPLVMDLGRNSYYTMLDMEFNKAITYLLDVLALIMSTEDSQEGVTAFLEKRTPIWKNK